MIKRVQNFNPLSFNFIQNQTNPIISSKLGGLKSDIFEPSTVSSLSNISFTSVDDGPDGNAIRELKGVPCPCCGLPVIAGSDVYQIGSAVLNGTSDKALESIKKFEPSLHPVQKEAFNMLESLSKKNPSQTVRQLLDSVRAEHIEKLKQEEFLVLDNMKAVKIKDKEKAKEISDFAESTRDIIVKQDEKYIFRRRRFLEKFTQIKSTMNDEKEIAELTKVADTMPKTYDNIHAYVVKYSQKNPKNGKEMTSEQAISALLRPSVGSIEHIIARHPRDSHVQPGKDRVSNYLYQCQDCNSEKSNTPLVEWLETHPEMIENSQKYIDEVIKRINNGAMKGFRAYPIEVAETLEKESNGKIKLDTSKLKISEQEIKQEQAQREKRYKRKEQKADRKYKTNNPPKQTNNFARVA